MKIGILTHPLHSNYGGILQCYALNTYLRKLGHDTVVIRRVPNKQFFLKRWLKYILRIIGVSRFRIKQTDNKSINLSRFVNSYIEYTTPVDSMRKMKSICRKYNLDSVVVGSDQVWREDFAMNYGYNYFLDFVPKNVVKLSYAASFGLSEWHYNSAQTCRINELLLEFRGISVRELDGVRLCQDYLNLSPSLLIDPTLLLDKVDYEKISSRRLIDEKYVLVYWLGDRSCIADTISKYQEDGYKVVDIQLRSNSILPSIGDWLSYIQFADFVITDSFHGCVFSLIFKKNFCIHSNDLGGNGRLTSLFTLLDIKETGNLIQPDYDKIADILTELRCRSYYFLNITLK